MDILEQIKDNLKATIKEKLYPISPIGLLWRGWDVLTNNTTYRTEHPEGEIRLAKKSSPTETIAGIPLAAATVRTVNPLALAATVPLAIGSALLLGNGPETMRRLNETSRSIRSSTYDLIGKIISRFDDIEDREPSSKQSVERLSSSPASSPNPLDNKDPDDKNKKSVLDLLWKSSGKPLLNKLIKLKPSRATIENFGFRLPLYTGVTAPILDLGFNAIGRAYTPDSIQYHMKFPMTKARFALERGIVGLIGDAYKETPSNNQDKDNTSSSRNNQEIRQFKRTDRFKRD